LQGDIPEDIFPQAIIDVRAVLDGRGSRFVKIRNHMKSFVSRQPLVRDLTPETSVEIEVLLQEWNRERQLRRATQPDDLEALSQIDASAYTVFANDFASRVDDNRYFSIVVEVETRPVGFAFAGRTAMHAAALYASISLTEYRGSAEFLLLKLLERLWTGGVRLLNLGGAETAGLHRFKTKFGVVGLRPTFDVELGL
jgi:hypothetical protein